MTTVRMNLRKRKTKKETQESRIIIKDCFVKLQRSIYVSNLAKGEIHTVLLPEFKLPETVETKKTTQESRITKECFVKLERSIYAFNLAKGEIRTVLLPEFKFPEVLFITDSPDTTYVSTILCDLEDPNPLEWLPVAMPEGRIFEEASANEGNPSEEENICTVLPLEPHENSSNSDSSEDDVNAKETPKEKPKMPPQQMKCLKNKRTFMKDTNSNSHFLKASENSNLKSKFFWKKISSFSNSKSYDSPKNVKKFNIYNRNRKKVSYGLQTNKSFEINSSESVTATHRLVSYNEDSSESSESSDDNLSQKNSAIKCNFHKQVLKNKARFPKETKRISLTFKRRTTDANSLFPNYFPHIQHRENRHSPTPKRAKYAINTSFLSHSENGGELTSPNNEINSSESVSATHSDLIEYSSDSSDDNLSQKNSAAKCNFQKKVFKNKALFPKETKINSFNFKRRYTDAIPLLPIFPRIQHRENRHSPTPKQVKYAENSSFLSHSENGGNSSLNKNNFSDNSSMKKQYCVSYCDNKSRSSVVNGDFNYGNNFREPSSKNFILNGSLENDNKGSTFFKVPTCRKESCYRPSRTPIYENRGAFDDELDHRKVKRNLSAFKPRELSDYKQEEKDTDDTSSIIPVPSSRSCGNYGHVLDMDW